MLNIICVNAGDYLGKGVEYVNILANMVIENRGGAGGMIGGTAVARAEPDGYSILLGSGATHIVGPLITPTKTFDPLKDFKSVSILSVSGLAVATHPSLPVKSLKELLAYPRRKCALRYR